ncbi:hypothetical protein N9N70_01460 [Candidatus Pelagibacter sp.]|nr:hypothetical protein [Candidatus Pelagibacter sp.]
MFPKDGVIVDKANALAAVPEDVGKTRETKYLAGLSIFFLCSYIAIILKN